MRIVIMSASLAILACVGPFAYELDGAWRAENQFTVLYRDGLSMGVYQGECTVPVSVEIVDRGSDWVEIRYHDPFGVAARQRLQFERGKLLIPIHEGRGWEIYERVDLEALLIKHDCLADAVASAD